MTKIRCAIYTRKSAEEGLEQDFNSLDAQREACTAYVASHKAEDWVLLPTVYEDAGISGGTLERPGLHRLLADIDAGLVEQVVVYKVDRLTRSRLVKKFVRHFDRVARPEYGLTRPCYTNYSGSTRLRVIADQYRNRPTILRLPKMNTASRRPDRPQNQNESSVPSRYRTRLSANAAKKSIELQ